MYAVNSGGGFGPKSSAQDNVNKYYAYKRTSGGSNGGGGNKSGGGKGWIVVLIIGIALMIIKAFVSR